jgi:hypothetical protein
MVLPARPVASWNCSPDSEGVRVKRLFLPRPAYNPLAMTFVAATSPGSLAWFWWANTPRVLIAAGRCRLCHFPIEDAIDPALSALWCDSALS